MTSILPSWNIRAAPTVSVTSRIVVVLEFVRLREETKGEKTHEALNDSRRVVTSSVGPFSEMTSRRNAI